MKTKLIIILFTSLLGCDQCDHDPPLTELEKLPPATQEGKNTFGCLVNGKAWVTKTSIDAAAFYQSGTLAISAVLKQAKVDQSLGFVIEDLDLAEGIYALDQPIYQYGVYDDARTKCFYTSTDAADAELTINKLDRANYIISATFRMTLHTAGCDTITITDGRFDLTYAP